MLVSEEKRSQRKKKVYLICLGVLSVCVCVCGSIGSPEIRVTVSWEQPCGYWELSPNPLDEQPVILTTELSLQCEVRDLTRKFVFGVMISNYRILNASFSSICLRMEIVGLKTCCFLISSHPGWCTPVIPAHCRLRQENKEFEANLTYIEKL